MAGLILLCALVVLVALLIWLSGLLTRWLPPSSNARPFLRAAIVVAAFPLMLADEIIGKYQFEALCRANGIEGVDISKAKGKSVEIEYGVRSFTKKTIIPIKQGDVIIRGSKSGGVLIIYKNYYANGGWVMRHTPINMGHAQTMFFNGNGCGFKQRNKIFSANNISQIN